MPVNYGAQAQKAANRFCGETVTYLSALFVVETKYLVPTQVPGYTPDGAANAEAAGARAFVFLKSDLTAKGKTPPAVASIITHQGVNWRISDVTHSDGARHRVVGTRPPTAEDNTALTAQAAQWPAPPTQ